VQESYLEDTSANRKTPDSTQVASDTKTAASVPDMGTARDGTEVMQ